jgi:O-antigen/teichoic acid export membrane protein
LTIRGLVPTGMGLNGEAPPPAGSPDHRLSAARSTAAEAAGFQPVFSLMSGRALAFAATFFVPAALARIFDPAEFGTYKQALLIFSTLYYIAPFGMAESLFYFLPRAPRAAGRYVANAVLFLAAAGVVCLALLGMAGATISRWLSNAALSEVLPLIGVYLLLMLMAAVLEIVLLAGKRYAWTASAYGVSDLLRAGFLLIPALLMRRVDALFVGAIAFAALRAGTVLLYLGREFRRELRPDPRLLRQQLAYAGPFGLAVLIEMLQANFHQYAVSYHFDAATFAVYAVGCLSPPFVDFVSTPAGNVMMMRMSAHAAEGRRKVMQAVWRDTARKLFLLIAPVVGLQLVAAREIIVVLFTSTYLASVPIFMVWSTAILLATAQADGVLRVYADTRFLLLLSTVRLLLVLALIVPCLLEFGLVGAALATVLATAVTKGIALGRVKRLLQADVASVLPWGSLGAVAAAAGGAAVAALIVKSQLDLAAPLVLVATIGVYAATYLALVFRLGLLTESERRAIGRGLRWVTVTAPRIAGFTRKG